MAVDAARRPWWQQATALVTVSAGGVITGLNFAPSTPAMTTPNGLPIHLLALERSAAGDLGGTSGEAAGGAQSGDALLRPAIVNIARHYLQLAQGKSPAETEALIWRSVSTDGTDHGPFCAAFASLTLELAAQAVGQQSWVTGGGSYPWPLHSWADVRVDQNPSSMAVTSIQQDARVHDRWHPLGDGYAPQPGDWVLFNHHVEVVTSYSDGVLRTIGANAGPDFTVDAHSFSGSLTADGVAGFVDNGHLAKAGTAASPGSSGKAPGTSGAEAGTSGAEPGTSGQALGANGPAPAKGTGQADIPGLGDAGSPPGSGQQGTGQQGTVQSQAKVPGTSQQGTGQAGTGHGGSAGSKAGSPHKGGSGSGHRATGRASRSHSSSGHARPGAQADIPGLVAPGDPTASGTPAAEGGPSRTAGHHPDTAKSTAAIPGATPAPSPTPQPSGTPQPSATPQPTSTGQPSGTRPSAARPATPQPATPQPSATQPSAARPSAGTSMQQTFITAVAPGAMAAQQRWGVPASVTIAQAIEESAWGQSSLAATYRNLFGIKGNGPAGSVLLPTQEFENGQWVTIDAPFRVYHNVAESISDHAELLATSGYYTRAMADRNVPDAFANDLTGVYATDPSYGANLIALMKLYNLYQYDVPVATQAPAAAATPSQATSPTPSATPSQPASPAPSAAPSASPVPAASPTPAPATSTPGTGTRTGASRASRAAAIPGVPGSNDTAASYGAPASYGSPAGRAATGQPGGGVAGGGAAAAVMGVEALAFARPGRPARGSERGRQARPPTRTVERLYEQELPDSVRSAFFTAARTPIARAEPMYKDIAAQTGISWKLLAACDWMQCQALPQLSPVHGERLGTRNADGTVYTTKSAALAQCATDLIELAFAVYRVDLTIARRMSIQELADVFGAFRWGGLLRRHRVSSLEFPYSVEGLTEGHTRMRWPAINEPNAPDRPGTRFRMPFGAVPVVLSLNYRATI